jgi:CheY-like chemotaxis protein
MVKILIVDDEHSQAEVLTMLFNVDGFEVAVAVNGKDALDRLDEVRPDVIVTDYMMPVMNGGELAGLVRASPQHAHVPIFLTSASEARQVEQHAQHFNAFLRKPYLYDDLLALVRQVLAPPQAS